jgi:hypothetical protein
VLLPALALSWAPVILAQGSERSWRRDGVVAVYVGTARSARYDVLTTRMCKVGDAAIRCSRFVAHAKQGCRVKSTDQRSCSVPFVPELPKFDPMTMLCANFL